MSPKVHALSAPQGAHTEGSQQSLLGTTWVPVANRTNKQTQINKHGPIVQEEDTDSHMIRPDHDTGLYRTENQPKKVRNARSSQCPGVRGAEVWYCWSHLALAAFSSPPWMNTQALALSQLHSVPGTEATHTKAPDVSPTPKPGADSRLTLHKTATGQQPVGKLPAYPHSYPRTKGQAHR